MRVCVPLLQFLALSGLTTADTYTATEGGSITGHCTFSAGGVRKFFCKNDCDKKENILAETAEDSVRNGRYSIQYTRLTNGRIMHVTIEHVTSADSGQYQCAMQRLLGTSYRKITFNVTKASPSAPSHGQPTPTEQNLYFLLLLIVIPAALLIAFVIYKKKKMHNDPEFEQNPKKIKENVYAPAFERADSTYQSLSPDTRDHDQIYCSLSPNTTRHSVDYYNQGK